MSEDINVDELNQRLGLLEGVENADVEQYLSFFLDNEEYAVDILRVQEIRCWEGATVIPNSPVSVKGVMNLRGTIVPVMDLRLRLGLPEQAYKPLTVVIVLKFETSDGREKISGVVVDAVADVHSISPDDIQQAPELSSNVNATFVKGLGCTESGALILLDPDTLLAI
ncbi:Purine-binding chemotaxis protein cheW [Catenovulum agarivorans DS-2]|uniref:Chemotaxis protein CheW n=1 Tax=Catenovulum agarivorans DS-2 TaxID=1328313 RepID=W7Q7F6_9ALTE|nr:chemotaxis protein CheW [Catenovulum agarivorans]EWH08704.1 Purine-binding chemotaxis protein cheW [Catenovulum agarivorans DS-2]